MTKYVLADYERNGYSDSDFYAIYYDDQEDRLSEYEYATTRFGACLCKDIQVPATEGTLSSFHIHRNEQGVPEYLLMPTKEIVERARVKLEDFIFSSLSAFDKQKVFDPEPDNLYENLEMCLKEKVKNQIFEETVCDACKGTAKWVNPKKANDVRECFRCHGTGHIKGNKKLNANGKVEFDIIPKGTCGKVISWKSFGTFYKNGYNKAGPDNTSVFLKTDDGKNFRATLKNLRMKRDVVSDKVLREKARHISFDYNFGAITRCAWLSHNFALEALSK